MVEYFTKMTFGMALGIGAALAGLYYVFLFDDGSKIEAKVVNKNIEYGLKEKERDRLKKDIEEGLKLKEKVATIGAQFKEAFEFLPAEFEAEKLIGDISKQAQVAGATVVKMAPQKNVPKEESKEQSKEQIKDNIYESLGIDFELKGSFSSLSLFIANISKIKRILEVEELKFINNEPDVESPILNLTGRIIGYRYLSQDDPGNPNAKKK